MLKEIIAAFLNNKYTYQEYLNQIISLDQNEPIIDYLLNQDNDNIDLMMITYLPLWLFHRDHFNNLDDYSNIYLSFFNNLKHDKLFDKIESWYIDNEILFVKGNNCYLLINSTNKDINYLLPIDLQNQTLICYNCNDEMLLNKNLLIPEYSFYLFEKKK